MGIDHEWEKRVRGYCFSKKVPLHMFDDVVQEALVVVWQKQGSDRLIFHCVKQRIAELLRDECWLGRPSRQGKWHDPMRSNVGDLQDRDFAGPESFPGMVYHQEEIRAAVRGLQPRQRDAVYARVWMQSTFKEAHVEYGLSPAPWYTAKTVLRERLKHLEDCQ